MTVAAFLAWTGAGLPIVQAPMTGFGGAALAIAEGRGDRSRPWAGQGVALAHAETITRRLSEAALQGVRS